MFFICVFTGESHGTLGTLKYWFIWGITMLMIVVDRKATPRIKSSITVGTHEFLWTGAGFLFTAVSPQCFPLGERLQTYITLKRFGSCVQIHVLFQSTTMGEWFVTYFTFIRFFTSVSSEVSFTLTVLSKSWISKI